MNVSEKRCEGCQKQRAKWREDFPVEWEGDNYVSRREMVKFLSLGSFLLAVSNWATAIASKFLHREIKGWKPLGLASDLKPNSSALFRFPTEKDPCIAVRKADGALVAYSSVCTHLSCAVVYDKENQELLCPCHNGRFELDRGTPIAGPPTRPLPRILLEERDGHIYASAREGA